MIGPQTKFADTLHQMKYRTPGEDFREAMNRISFGLKDSDEHYHELRSIQLGQRFLMAGRIQSAIGSTRETTPYNCFVSGDVEDSFVDGPGCIMERAHQAAATMRMGGGIGYDFSKLRPRGDLIRKLQSHSSGPISFMHIFDAVCLATASSGHRRGAQMGVLRIDHPDIAEFIKAKQNNDQLTGFNLSIAVTDEFMDAALNGKSFDLRFGGTVYSTIDAAALWESVMRSTWDYGEPGVMFIDRINQYNNLWYAETISATNPCAEQPLPPYGACLLGSFCLPRYLTKRASRAVGPGLSQMVWEFDYDQLCSDIPHIVRAMDNVVDRSRYPLPQQKAEAVTKRRLGIGVTGLANAGEAQGFPYGSDEFLQFERKVLNTILQETYRASALLAKEKGAFPLYDEVKYNAGKFVTAALDDEVRYLIQKFGIRNSHLTSIAPTGTISMCADNVSSGLEPVFAYASKRPINTPDGTIVYDVNDYGAEVLNVRGRLANDVSAAEHVKVLATAQQCVDSSVSKTVNMDGSMPWDAFKDIYKNAYELGCKSCATFNNDGKRGSLLKSAEDREIPLVVGSSCEIDPETGRRDCG